ncbi:MAG TPA: hypothetical protein VHA37_07565 [Candidatus Saccharimonadales bacterium]|nr:hypothetical protein [Candidatus Saccharimonadales bacterium]
MTPKPDIDDLVEALKERLTQAYERGFKAGAEAMRLSIMAAAERAPLTPAPSPEPESVRESRIEPTTRTRAPRGRVQEVLEQVLSPDYGLSLSRIKEEVVQIDGRISPKSVYNVLNLNDKKRYVREGDFWRLARPEEPRPAELRPPPAGTWVTGSPEGR